MRVVVVVVLLFLYLVSYAATDGIIAYRSNTGTNTLSSPKIRFWNASANNGNGAWGSEIELPSAGSPVRWAVVKWSRALYKIAVITLSDDGYLDAYVCITDCTNVGNWVYSSNIGFVGAGPAQRRFDFEFESNTGDLIVVYGVSSAVPTRDLAYKILPANTTTFTGIPEQYIDDTGHGTDIQYTWVRIDRNPLDSSEELIVVGFDSSNTDINAWVWNGNAWGNQIEISGTATATGGYEALAVRYAADGSKGMAIGGDGTVGNVNTRYWNGIAWSATITFDITSGNQDVRWANLKADPASDDLQGVFIDSGARLGTAYWNGSTWLTTVDIDTGLDTSTARCVDFAWDKKGDQGYLVWDTDGAGTTLSYRLCAPQCTAATQTTSTYAGTGAWITMFTIPTTISTNVRTLNARLNSNFDIGSFVANSSTPTFYNYGDGAITTDTTVTTYEAYSIALNITDSIPPSITFTPPTPANDSTVGVDWVFINTSITDNILVYTALLEWNGTNETMNYTNSTNWYKNKTGLAQGSYTYRVWARDLAGNWNVSETRTVVYGTPPIVIIIAPHGEEYDQHSLVSLSINATDPDGINSSIAEVALPNGTKENITLGSGLDSDNFDSNTMNTKWFLENISIGPGQTCVADIDTTLPDRAFISLSGDGSPQTDTLCSIISKKAIDGDFDINISFEILGSLEPDTAFNFQITEKPTSANATKMIFIALSNWTGFGHLYEIYASDGTFSDYILSRETNDTYGKMRIKRAGNNFTFYTWNNTAGEWIEENVSQNEFNFSRAVFVTFEGESVSPGWGEINISLDNFSVWSNNFTFGLFNNTHALGLYNVTFYVRDNIGAMNNSERTNFTIAQINDPPSTPFILTPSIGSKIWGTYNISWSEVYDEEGDNVWFNITLLNSDYSYNTTIASNYGNITSTSYEWDTTAHADGFYSLRIVVFENETSRHLSNEFTLPGTFEILNNPPIPPLVEILEPLGGEYPDIKPVSIAANITDPEGTGINTTYATITYPNGTEENITLYKCVGGDNFETQDSIYNWWNENITIGPGQTCVANVNGTVPGKAYTSISGDGSPLSDTLCSLVSRRAIYGDFDMNVSFEILDESGVDYAINFELAEISSSANASYYVLIALSNWTGLGRNYEVFADDGNISGYITKRETEDTFGKMRIKRAGNNFTFYTWNNTAGEWIEENSTILNISTSLFVIMESESTYPGWGSINASWDNLSIAHDNNTYFSVFDGNVHPLGLYNVSFYARTNKGGVNDTERSNFTVININNPPSKPFILTPFPGEIAYGTYHITWSDVVDPDGDTLQFNITLLNPDGSDNATIVSNYGNSSSNQYLWDTTPYPNGEYSMRVIVFENETAEHLSNSYTLTGTFYIDNDAPAVFIIAPHGEDYPQFAPVSISINATDPDGIEYSIAEITYPNGTVENITLEKGQQSDDFSVDSLGINWTSEESIGPLQNCIADIDTTIPDKAFTGISGDGTPESDTLCSIISKKAIDGAFDIQIDFNIEGYEGTDIALNFQITEIPSSAEASKMAFISLSNWTGLGRNYEVFVDDGNISGYITKRETEDTFGKMRIKRAGNNFTFYTWNNTAGEWIEENSTELDFARAVYVTMESESAYPGWGSINVSWDNFIVNDSNNTFGMFENTDLLGLYNVTIFVSDIYGRVNNTEKTNFTIVYHNYAPSKPYLLTPFPGEIASGNYQIAWSNVFDVNNDTLQFNITLLNPDLTYNATIVSNYGNSSSTHYLWDTTLYPDGEYSMEILVFENETPEGLSNSYTLTGNFSIDNTPPSIQFEPPTEISGSTIPRNYILVNVSAYDPHLNLIAIRLYNSSGDLLNETFSLTSPFFVNFTGLEDGLYYFNATALDNVANENSTETRNVTVLTFANVSAIKLNQTAFQPSPGGTVEFNITITNTGNVTLDPVLLVDTLPNALIYSSASISPDSVIGGVVTWNNIGPITPGNSVIIYLNATVNGSYGCDYNVTNLINVSGVPPNGDNATAYDTAEVYLACANVSALKLDQTAFQPSPGGTVEFNITITNTGNVTLNPVLLVDTLPNALIYSSVSISPDSVRGGVVTWNNVGPLNPGDSTVIYVNATVNGSYGCDYNVTNLINVSGVPPNGDNATAYDTAEVYLACANISVVKVDISPVPVSPGGIVEWRINISNPGQVPLDPVFVSDTLPEGFQYDSASPVPDEISDDNRTMNWTNVGPLPVGGSTIILLNSSVGNVANGTYYNTVFVVGTPPNGDDVNASDTAQVGIFAPGINIVKTANPTSVLVRQNVTYTLNISSTGSVNITVTVIDVLPFNVSFEGASIPPTQIMGQVLIWENLTNLSIGESTLLIYNVSANASGTYTNNATAIGVPQSGYNVSDSSYATFTASSPRPPSERRREHELYIHPISNQRAKVGETKTVSITIENTGDYNEYDVVLSLNCPSSFLCKNASLGTIREGAKKNAAIEIIGRIEGDYLLRAEARNDETYASREFLFTVLPECVSDKDCKEDEKCEGSKCAKFECECGYIQDHRCIHYECCSDSDCNETSKCVNNTCVERQYNMAVLGENVSVGENFTLYIEEEGAPAPGMAVVVLYPDGSTGIFISDENGIITFFAPQEGRYLFYLRDVPSVSGVVYSSIPMPAFVQQTKQTEPAQQILPKPTPERKEEQPTCCLFGICGSILSICWYWWALAVAVAGAAVVFRTTFLRSRPSGPPKWKGFNRNGRNGIFGP